jgi:hypothetical protein
MTKNEKALEIIKSAGIDGALLSEFIALWPNKTNTSLRVAINALRNQGHKILCIRAKGYRLEA